MSPLPSPPLPIPLLPLPHPTPSPPHPSPSLTQDVQLMRYRSHVLHRLLEGFVLR